MRIFGESAVAEVVEGFQRSGGSEGVVVCV